VVNGHVVTTLRAGQFAGRFGPARDLLIANGLFLSRSVQGDSAGWHAINRNSSLHLPAWPFTTFGAPSCGFVRLMVVRIFVIVIRVRRGVRRLKTTPNTFCLPLAKQFESFADLPRARKIAAHHKQGAIHLRRQGGCVIGCKNRAAVYEHIIELPAQPART